MRIFALKGSEQLGDAIARSLWTEVERHEERDFEDGEHKARPLVGVRGEDVYVVHSLAGGDGASANDRLVKLLFFIAACKENGAARVTAVVPYLAYARKDRQTKPRDPVTTRYVAQLFEAVGTDCVMAVEVHNIVAFQNAFRCRTVHLDTRRLFSPSIRKLADGLPVTVFSPDGGGVKRAQLLKETYEADAGEEAGFGFMEKRRSGGVVSGDLFAGDVKGSAVFIVDDMISTGGTMLRAAKACRAHGARKVYTLAAHGLFSEGSPAMLDDPAIDAVIVTDTLPSAARAAAGWPAGRIEVLPIGALIGETIRRLSANGSITDLLGSPG